MADIRDFEGDALLEDFDHLYRYSNLYQLSEGKDAKDVIGDDLTEVFPSKNR